MLPNTLLRTDKGLHALARAGKDLPPETKETFMLAMNSLGYLIKVGETITLDEWKARISQVYDVTNPKCIEVLAAIDAAKIPDTEHPTTTTGEVHE